MGFWNKSYKRGYKFRFVNEFYFRNRLEGCGLIFISVINIIIIWKLLIIYNL